MYKSFYNLKRKPFELTPDPFFLFPSPRHNEALATLYHGVRGHKGFVVLTGEVGTQRSAFQSLNRSWVGAVIKEVVEWSFHSTSIHGWRRPRLCRVFSLEEAENTGRGKFTRHSPELGIVATMPSSA